MTGKTDDEIVLCSCGFEMSKYNPHEHNFTSYEEKIAYFKKRLEQARANERAKIIEELKDEDAAFDFGFKAGIDAVEKKLAKEGLERKQLNLVDGYIQVDDLIERIEEALAAARKNKTRVSAETVHPSSCGKKSEED